MFAQGAFAVGILPLLVSCSPVVETRQTATAIAVNVAQKYQTIDGFGFSEAFQRANGIVNLPEPKRSEVIDLLYNTTSGAGLTILRIGIGSSPNSTNDWMNTILPTGPSSPSGTPNYVWDGKDSGQLWVAQQGVSSFPMNEPCKQLIGSRSNMGSKPSTPTLGVLLVS
jgi:hypothetical protein